MSHPTNRRHRFIISNQKAIKRVGLWFNCQFWQREGEAKRKEAFKAQLIRHRDTTKLCGGPCCANPRHNGWEKSGSRFTMQERKFEEGFKKDL